MTNNISFKSTFKPVTKSEFSKIALRIPKQFSVDYPWTIKKSVTAVEAITNNVYDCSVLGISDGENVFLMHICPTIKENSNFNKIKDFILKKINIHKPNLQAVLIGSQKSWENSKKLNDFLLDLTKKWNIPCSIFGTGKNPVNVAYSSKTDEWSMTSYYIEKSILEGDKNPEKIFKTEFDDVKLSSFDEFA